MLPRENGSGRMPHVISTLHYLLVFLGIIAYWYLRTSYWLVTDELPFSDMADFERIALNILRNGSFDFDNFWRSYKPPTLPALGALIFWIFGEGNYLAWRLFQTILTFLGLLWLSIEIVRVTKVRWHGVALIWFVALSKASIFWSYKFASEGIAEAFIYLCSAGILCSFRTKSASWWVFSGMLCAASILNRPNFIVVPGLILLCVITLRSIDASASKRFKLSLAFCAGLAVMWSPWLIRTYNLYGVPLLGNTSGGYNLIFELGNLTFTDREGATVTKNSNQLQAEASHDFQNDYEAQKFAQQVFFEWLSHNRRAYLNLVLNRIVNAVKMHTVILTKVSRTDLFSGYKDRFLIDKSTAFFIVGATGLLIWATAESYLFLILFLITITPWIFSMFFLSTSRLLDPSLPIILFGSCAWIELCVKLLCRKKATV